MQGEPLNNTEAVLTAIEIASHKIGLRFGKNKITVSTVGLVPDIRTFCARSSAQLAVSLHAPTDEIRDWIAPINRRYPLQELIGCLEYALFTAPTDPLHNLKLHHHEVPKFV